MTRAPAAWSSTVLLVLGFLVFMYLGAFIAAQLADAPRRSLEKIESNMDAQHTATLTADRDALRLALEKIESNLSTDPSSVAYRIARDALDATYGHRTGKPLAVPRSPVEQ